jgi:DNA-binding transcriptional MerR regulator
VAWSTRELAELAGTTVKAVRHYHKLGLLEEPERQPNGYKQYEVSHFVRLLRITRLADLGVPLSKIATMGTADENPDTALRVIDAELAATITRLQGIRGELALILANRTPAEMPAGFGAAGHSLSEADRSLVMIYSRVFDESAMTEMQRMLEEEPRTAADDQFDSLAPDADRATRSRLAETLAPVIGALTEEYPWLQDPTAHAPRGKAFVEGTAVQALVELYNPAQLDVLYRVHLINKGTAEERAAFEAAPDAAETGPAADVGPAADTAETPPHSDERMTP